MNNDWSKEETIIAFNVYCKIPFKSSSKTNPIIVKYSKLLGRSPSALNMKIGNIGRLDPDLKDRGITGLIHGAKMEEKVWNEFYGNPEHLAFESERLIAQLSHKSLEETSTIEFENIPEGKSKEIIIKQRINQSFFRSAVMSSYNFCCCISGLKSPELLEACHIVDWSEDSLNRLNPKNGLCMNPLFHKAYDSNLIAITPDLEIIVSDKMIEDASSQDFRHYLIGVNGKKINSPDRFFPKTDFLEIHYNRFKLKQG